MNRDLTQGKIFSSLLRLALPIAAGQVMQMAYNLTDMFWLGRVSSQALAATGAAGIFIWLSVGFMMIGRIGAEVGCSQAHGRGDMADAYRYSRVSLCLAAVLGLLYGVFLFSFRNLLVGFLNFDEIYVAADAALYAGIMAIGIPAMFVSSAIGGAFVAAGNSRTPFLINAAGLILNMILTPLVIFGMGLGVFGAAVSSVLSKYVVLVVSLYAIKHFRSRPFAEYQIITKICLSAIMHNLRAGTAHKILRLTTPVCLENLLWPLLTLITTRIELEFGAIALSISRVGIQVESLSWLVGAGFGAALTTFVGQNYGANKPDRIRRGVRYTAGTLFVWGGLVTLFMWFGGALVFRLFLPNYIQDQNMRQLFITHMRILASCQIFANMEYVAGNAFRGKGRTSPPAKSSIASNVIRVPLAFILSRTSLGVLGVWAAISFTAGLRGVLVGIWYWWDGKKEKKATCV